MERRVVLLVLLVVHLAVASFHGTAHALVPVTLPAWQNALVVLTTFLGPVAGVALAWRDHPLGVPVFTLSMAGALLLGGVLHFAVENPDNVGAVPPDAWRLPFQVSAAGVAALPLIGLVVGAAYWRGD